MKSNGTLNLFVKAFSFILVLLFSKYVIAQPDYDFRNPVLESGTNLQKLFSPISIVVESKKVMWNL